MFYNVMNWDELSFLGCASLHLVQPISLSKNSSFHLIIGRLSDLALGFLSLTRSSDLAQPNRPNEKTSSSYLRKTVRSRTQPPISDRIVGSGIAQQPRQETKLGRLLDLVQPKQNELPIVISPFQGRQPKLGQPQPGCHKCAVVTARVRFSLS